MFKNLRRIAVFIILILGPKLSNAQQTGEPPAVRELTPIPLSRTEIIQRVVSSDSLMLFTERSKFYGLRNFIGSDENKSSVQLAGEEYDLKLAKFTFAFTTDKRVNALQYKRLSYFVFSIGGKECLNWFYDVSAQFVKNPLIAFKSTKSFFLELKADFSYEPANKAMVFSFTTPDYKYIVKGN